VSPRTLAAVGCRQAAPAGATVPRNGGSGLFGVGGTTHSPLSTPRTPTEATLASSSTAPPPSPPGVSETASWPFCTARCGTKSRDPLSLSAAANASEVVGCAVCAPIARSTALRYRGDRPKIRFTSACPSPEPDGTSSTAVTASPTACVTNARRPSRVMTTERASRARSTVKRVASVSASGPVSA